MSLKNIENRKVYCRKYYLKHKEKMNEINKQYHLEHREEEKAYGKRYYLEHKEKKKQYKIDNRDIISKQKKRYYLANKDKMLRRHKQWIFDNKEKISKWQIKWNIDNNERINECRRKRYIKRYKTNLKYNLTVKMRGEINRSLKGNKAGYHWESLTGYTLADLINRLNENIPAGYTWKDFLTGELHIDHIIPISVFNFTKPEHTDFKRCWALSNLRLLPARENLIKHNKLTRPFQLALKI